MKDTYGYTVYFVMFVFFLYETAPYQEHASPPLFDFPVNCIMVVNSFLENK